MDSLQDDARTSALYDFPKALFYIIKHSLQIEKSDISIGYPIRLLR